MNKNSTKSATDRGVARAENFYERRFSLNGRCDFLWADPDLCLTEILTFVITLIPAKSISDCIGV